MREPYRKYLKVFLNLLTAAVILLVCIFLLPRIMRFFLPFIVAWIIALLANPVVHFLDKRLRIKRKAGSAIVIIAAIGLVILALYGIGSVLFREARGFIRELPELWVALENDIAYAGNSLRGLKSLISPQIEEMLLELGEGLKGVLSKMADSLSSPTVEAVGNIASQVPSFFVSFIMCLLSCYCFVAEQEGIQQFAGKYIPEAFRKRWAIFSDSLKKAVGGYFKAQFKIEIWIYMLLIVGLALLKVKYGLIIALVIAFLDLLPVFGAGAVLWPWALVKFLGGNYKMAIGLMVIWGVCQIVRQLIQPKIVGDSIGVPAIPTLFLIYVGYKFGGVLGMLLAVPTGIILFNMYQAGFFKTTEDSLRILINGFNRFRRLSPKDLEMTGQDKKES